MRALVLYNNHSGKNKAAQRLEYICTTLKRKYEIVECFKSVHPKSITECILEKGSNFDLILGVGGDGTVNELINGIMQLDKKPTLAYIPVGTCNDAARTLGLTKNLKKTLNNILQGDSRRIDAFKVNDKYFIYGLAAGCFTEISYNASFRVKRRFGKLAYYFQGLKAYKDTKAINIKLINDKEIIDGDFSLFLALNSRYLAGFKIHRKNRIFLNDGKLRLTLIKKSNKLMNIIDFGMFLLFGESYKHNMLHLNSSKFSIESNDFITYNTDGERFDSPKRIDVEVIPKSIEVIISKRVKRRHFL